MTSVFGPPSQTRLVVILAHVDHGKTTLADNLISHNGIISERLAGTLRFLDSDPEEQRRGITMRSSAIGIQYQYVSHKTSSQSMIVHLIDSPGHADFAREVSSSLLICDAAILVVDVMEGMGARTQQVFRESYSYKLTPILVINKLDRLIEMDLTPAEAYVKLRGLLETINAATAAMVASSENCSEELENLWTFDPAKNNVVFCSALFGWGFTSLSICRSLFRNKIVPFKPPILRQALFGDCKLKNDKILVWKQSSEDLPLFAEFALQPLWDIYEGVTLAAGGLAKDAKIRPNDPGMDQVKRALQLAFTSSTAPDLDAILTKTASGNSEAVLRSILQQYRPLADAVLHSVCDYCPSPSVTRSPALKLQLSNEPNASQKRLRDSVLNCDVSLDAPTVAFVCKFLCTDKLHLRDSGLPDSTSDSVILGLARVLSGSLETDKAYHAFGPKYKKGADIAPRIVRLYLLMGSSFIAVDRVPAGHVCAVYGLEDLELKTVTLSDSTECEPVYGFNQNARPLVKVNIEPEQTSDVDYLEKGLAKLSLADGAVEVTTTDKGERLLSCLGELHLEQSIRDLEKIYCGKEGIKLKISDPIVDFAETTVWFDSTEVDNYSAFYDDASPPLRQTTIPPYNDEEGIQNAKHGRARAIVSGRSAALHVRVLPLLTSVHKALCDRVLPQDDDECSAELLRIGQALNIKDVSSSAVLSALLDSLVFTGENNTALIEFAGVRDGSCIQGVEAKEIYLPSESGSSKVEANGEPFENNTPGRSAYNDLRSKIRGGLRWSSPVESFSESDKGAQLIWTNMMRGSVVAGMQMAIRAGPICEEPMRNILVVIEGIEVAVEQRGEGNYKPSAPIAGGMIVSALRTGIRCALLTRPLRLMEGHLKLTLHSSLAGLGSLYQVLSKRRGKVVEDSMVDGTDLLMITAMIPQADAFGLTPELFAKSSGEVTAPEMLFSHWDHLDVDPFWIPTSEEEREDYGELQTAGDSSTGLDNTALSYIRSVRKRKGLTVDSTLTVTNAEKQRTLKR